VCCSAFLQKKESAFFRNGGVDFVNDKDNKKVKQMERRKAVKQLSLANIELMKEHPVR